MKRNPVISSSILGITDVTTKALSLTLKVRSSGSVDAELRTHLVENYGKRWLGVSAIFPSLPHFVRALELCILAGTQESISKFRKDQETLLANTGTTAAIISQVTVTSIQLSNVDQMHWSVRACFFSSLVFSLGSVFLSFLKHRDIGSMNSHDIRSRFTVESRRLNMSVVIALYLPYSILNAAIIIYSFALSLYLVSSCVPSMNTDGTTSLDNRNILLFFLFSTFIGYVAQVFVQRSRLYQKPSLESGTLSDGTTNSANHYPPKSPPLMKDQPLNMLHQGGIDGFERERSYMEKTYNSKYMPGNKKDDPMDRTATRSPNDCMELAKALAEAAKAHKAAAAASAAVAAQYEKLSGVSSFQRFQYVDNPLIVSPVKRTSTWPRAPNLSQTITGETLV